MHAASKRPSSDSIVVVSGYRRCGKSVMMRAITEGLRDGRTLLPMDNFLSLPCLPAGDWLLIWMHREGKGDYRTRRALGIMEQRRDVELIRVDFKHFVENPARILSKIKTSPIGRVRLDLDVEKAASVIKPEFYRERRIKSDNSKIRRVKRTAESNHREAAERTQNG